MSDFAFIQSDTLGRHFGPAKVLDYLMGVHVTTSVMVFVISILSLFLVLSFLGAWSRLEGLANRWRYLVAAPRLIDEAYQKVMILILGSSTQSM